MPVDPANAVYGDSDAFMLLQERLMIALTTLRDKDDVRKPCAAQYDDIAKVIVDLVKNLSGYDLVGLKDYGLDRMKIKPQD